MKKTSAQNSFSNAFAEKLKSVHSSSKEIFTKKHPHAEKFLKDRKVELGKIREHSTKLLTAGVLAGSLLVNTPDSFPNPTVSRETAKSLNDIRLAVPVEPRQFLVEEIKKMIPKKVNNLSTDQEKEVSLLFEKLTGIKAKASLEGERLNTNYGYMGAEQHLPRFPNDTVLGHDEFLESGITPGRGAWSYFAPSQQQLSKEDILREKYYVAVQTLYLPDWDKRLPYLRDWYKYRKVLVLNPNTGQAVIAVVGDSGPAAWTGKQFGGSPEVMYHTGLYQGPRKGAVILFFVDDPKNLVPLGPVDYQRLNLPNVEIKEAGVSI